MAVISTEQRHSLVHVEVCWDPPSESEGRATVICDHYRHSSDTMLLYCLAHLNEPHSVHAVSRKENSLNDIPEDHQS